MREPNDIVRAPLQQRPAFPAIQLPAQGSMQYGAPALSESLPPETPEPSLIRPILRQWWLVALCMAITGAAAILYVKKAQPLYTSFAKIEIQPAAPSATIIMKTEGSNFLPAQLDVIKGSKILNRVADMDGMRTMRTFAPARGNPVLFLRERLEATLDRKTDLITIALESAYKEEAAAIVQAVVDAYSLSTREEKDNLNGKLLETFKKNLADTTEETKQLFNKIQELRIANPTVNPNPNVAGMADTSLRDVIAKLGASQLRLIDLQRQYGSAHQEVQREAAKFAALQTMYNSLCKDLAKEYSVATELKALSDRYETELAVTRKLGEEIRQMEGAITTSNLVTVNTIDPPVISDIPSSPQKGRILSIAVVIGGLIGAGIALLRDRADGRMHSVEEIQSIVNLPILGVVPAMSGRRTAIARAMTVHLDPRSVVAEAYRTIRTAVYFGTNNARCKTILMTSPEPGDGKTTSASNLAIAIAQTGRTVLLLDADFRKPTQHKNLDIKDTVGLSSVLSGRETLERAIQNTGVDGLHILPCGPIPANPSEILNSREFGELIDSLAVKYDHIIFDSPPVNAVTDARILGAVCDATILVLRADKSTRKSGEHARNALMAVGANVLGAIVNDAPNGKGYEVYGSSYYYGTKDRSASAGVIPASRRLPGNNSTQEESEQREATRRRNIA